MWQRVNETFLPPDSSSGCIIRSITRIFLRLNMLHLCFLNKINRWTKSGVSSISSLLCTAAVKNFLSLSMSSLNPHMAHMCSEVNFHLIYHYVWTFLLSPTCTAGGLSPLVLLLKYVTMEINMHMHLVLSSTVSHLTLTSCHNWSH